MSDTRQHVHELVDQLAPVQLDALETILKSMLDPVSRALANAPIDDEPVTEEEEAAVARSKEWFKHNEGIPFEQVVAELGFTMDQIRNASDPSVQDPAA